MADLVICKKTDLTGIANEVRTISGTSNSLSLDAIQTELNNANTEANIQADLISQITTALEGKAAGGDSGGSVETCSLTVNAMDEVPVYCTTVDENGTFSGCKATWVSDGMISSAFIKDVVCGSVFTIGQTAQAIYIEGTAELLSDSVVSIYKAPIVADEECIITL